VSGWALSQRGDAAGYLHVQGCQAGGVRAVRECVCGGPARACAKMLLRLRSARPVSERMEGFGVAGLQILRIVDWPKSKGLRDQVLPSMRKKALQGAFGKAKAGAVFVLLGGVRGYEFDKEVLRRLPAMPKEGPLHTAKQKPRQPGDQKRASGD